MRRRAIATPVGPSSELSSVSVVCRHARPLPVSNGRSARLPLGLSVCVAGVPRRRAYPHPHPGSRPPRRRVGVRARQRRVAPAVASRRARCRAPQLRSSSSPFAPARSLPPKTAPDTTAHEAWAGGWENANRVVPNRGAVCQVPLRARLNRAPRVSAASPLSLPGLLIPHSPLYLLPLTAPSRLKSSPSKEYPT